MFIFLYTYASKIIILKFWIINIINDIAIRNDQGKEAFILIVIPYARHQFSS